MRISINLLFIPLTSLLILNVSSMPKKRFHKDEKLLDTDEGNLPKITDQTGADLHAKEEFLKKSLPGLHNFGAYRDSYSEALIRFIRSDRNNSRSKNHGVFSNMEHDDDLSKPTFGSNHVRSNGSKGNGEDDTLILGAASDYVLIAMIVAMMFCMTLCCLCLFCRSSSRLSICGINFELNDRRNSAGDGENQSEIHEVVPLTPTTAGDHNNRLPDIENMLRGDAPPLYNEIVKKAEAASEDHQAKAKCKSSKKKSNSERVSDSSSVRSNGGRSSWRLSGRGLLASFRARSKLRSRRSDSAIQCPTVQEDAVLRSRSDHVLQPTIEEVDTISQHAEGCEAVTMETVNEVTKEKRESKKDKIFVYDVNEIAPDEDDDVFL